VTPALLAIALLDITPVWNKPVWPPKNQFIWGAELSVPQIVSVSAGIFAREKAEGETGASNGFLLEVEPGLGGGRINLGYGWVADQPVGSWAEPPMGAFVIKASFYETWGPTTFIAPLRSYVGGTLEAAYGLRICLGAFGKVSGDPEGADVLVVAGVGFGL
jgi:hypothetical protein